MLLNYHITADDVVHFNIYHFHQSPVTQKQQSITRVVFSCGVGIISLAGMYLIYGSANLFISCSSALFAGVFIYIIYSSMAQHATREQTIKTLAEGKNKGVTGEQTLTLTPDAIICVSEAGESRINWSSIERVGTTEEYAFIYVGSVNALIVPRRAFSDNDAYQRFLEYITTHSHDQANP